MDRSSIVIIHASHQSHQRLYADHIKSGFLRLGYTCLISDDPNEFGDIHVVIGPHYAFRQNLGKKTLYIDRCLWGDDLEYVTIGWLNSDGGMKYPNGCDGSRSKPDLKDWQNIKESRAIMLLDYGPYPLELCHLAKKSYGHVSYRVHPATGKKQPLLIDHLKGHKVAIGYRTSALFTAVTEGVPVISFDHRSPVYDIAGHDILDVKYPDREQWLNNMSYAQWSGEEIRSGEALKYVLDHKADDRAIHASRG